MVESIERAICKNARIRSLDGWYYRIDKKSLDARKEPIVNRFRVSLQQEPFEDQPTFTPRVENTDDTAIVVGFGPAGMFAALQLLESGIKPIVIERGKPVKERRRDLVDIFRKQHVHIDSNYCFGEGGAGTFSDGKLYTRSKKGVRSNRCCKHLSIMEHQTTYCTKPIHTLELINFLKL